MRTICPELLAKKIHTRAFFDTEPAERRWREMLWHIQAESMKEDGLYNLAEALIADGVTWKDFFRDEEPSKSPAHILDFMKDLCSGRAAWGERSCPGFFKALLRHIDRQAKRTFATIAPTEVTKIIFRELEFSISETEPVALVGDSRMGKTSAAAIWCEARPGRARLVTVPETNTERDWMCAHADALGIDYTSNTTLTGLRSRVRDVIRHAGLFIVYDESQGLIPSSYTKTTAPGRLNFVRFNLIDKQVGCAFFATPQSYRQTLDQYVKTTGYRMDQWLGRVVRQVVLPDNLGKDDLLAVAKCHFPDFEELLLKRIVARALISEGYLKSVQVTAKRARFIAREDDGREKVCLKDVLQAIEEVLPETVAQIKRGEDAAPLSPVKRAAAAPPAPTPGSSDIPVRHHRVKLARSGDDLVAA